jgi:ATP-binding cassette, subfamily B, multidrug efflux pump
MSQKQDERANAKREPVLTGDTKPLRFVLRFLRPNALHVVGASVALLLASLSYLITPQLFRYAIDSGIARRRSETILLATGGLVAVAVGRGLFTFLEGYWAERASQGFAYNLREALFARIQRLSFSYYDRSSTGELVTRLTDDVEQIRSFIGHGAVQLGAAVLMLLGSLILLLELNWRLSLVAFLMIAAIYLLLRYFARNVEPLFDEIRQRLGRLNSILHEDLIGARIIRTFGREDHESTRYHASNNVLLEKNLVAIRATSNNVPLILLCTNLATLAVVWYGGIEIIDGSFTIGGFVAFNAYLSFLLVPVLTIGSIAIFATQARISSARIREIFDIPLEIHDTPGAAPLPPVKGEVELTDVHFRYPGSQREILRGVSFRTPAGMTVAILGRTGSGKSSLLNLLPRFYDVTSGRVCIDGYDIRDVTVESLRRQIGVVLQDALLFSGSVRENISYGKPEATEEEIIEASRAASADEFIRMLPQGYDTILNERGIGLSGGQRQRIAIARALLVAPRILLLDDSTSAVDAATESIIQEALNKLISMSRHTTFIIAHRISTVRNADIVLLLDEGRIHAQGTHAQLIRESALYNEIIETQLIAEVETNDAPALVRNSQPAAS